MVTRSSMSMTHNAATNSRPFDVLLFDLGSTLIYFADSWDERMECARHALADALPELPRAELIAHFKTQQASNYARRDRDLVETPAEQILNRVLEEMTCPLPARRQRQALDAFYAVMQQSWLPELDALPTLQTLLAEGYRLGLLSNAGDTPDVNMLLRKAHLTECFERIWVSADIGYRKPHRRSFEPALKHFDLPAARMAMIGDLLGADILGAHNAGMSGIWITRRAANAENERDREQIVPEASIATLAELPELLRHWPGKK